MHSPSNKETRSLSYLNSVALKNPSCGSGNFLLLSAETPTFTSDHSQFITNISLARTSRAKAVFNSPVAQAFANNSSVTSEVIQGENTNGSEVGRRTLRRPCTERMKGKENKEIHLWRIN